MKVILKDPTTNKRWKIEPLANGQCFQIWKEPDYTVDSEGKRIGKNGKEIKEDWVFTEKYPSDLYQAVWTTVSLMIKDPSSDLDIDLEEVNNISEALKELKKSIDSMTKKIVSGIEKEN